MGKILNLNNATTKVEKSNFVPEIFFIFQRPSFQGGDFKVIIGLQERMKKIDEAFEIDEVFGESQISSDQS